MTQDRMALRLAAPSGYAAMLGLGKYLHVSGLDRTIVDLVKIRASQINRCAFCLDMHTREALTAGDDDRRLHTLAAWREAPWFTEREQAALALTEAVTLVADTAVPDQVWQRAAALFDQRELADL